MWYIEFAKHPVQGTRVDAEYNVSADDMEFYGESGIYINRQRTYDFPELEAEMKAIIALPKAERYAPWKIFQEKLFQIAKTVKA